MWRPVAAPMSTLTVPSAMSLWRLSRRDTGERVFQGGWPLCLGKEVSHKHIDRKRPIMKLLTSKTSSISSKVIPFVSGAVKNI